MPVLKNVSPRGDLEIPLVRRVVKAGETFEVTDEQAAVLLEQAENYVLADEKKAAK